MSKELRKKPKQDDTPKKSLKSRFWKIIKSTPSNFFNMGINPDKDREEQYALFHATKKIVFFEDGFSLVGKEDSFVSMKSDIYKEWHAALYEKLKKDYVVIRNSSIIKEAAVIMSKHAITVPKEDEAEDGIPEASKTILKAREMQADLASEVVDLDVEKDEGEGEGEHEDMDDPENWNTDDEV